MPAEARKKGIKMKLTLEEKKQRLEDRRKAKEEAKELAIISMEKSQKPVKSIKINIEWKKSRMWGYNPHAEAWVSFQDGNSDYISDVTCSGCGYDKESTVIAKIFNKYLRYALWNKTLEQCKRDDHNWRVNNAAPYGICAGKWSEYNNKMPLLEYRSFSGGIGTSCYYAIAEFIGGKFENIASGKTFDCFLFTMND